MRPAREDFIAEIKKKETELDSMKSGVFTLKAELAATEAKRQEVLAQANDQANKLIQEAREAAAKVQAQENEKNAIAEARRAETICEFVTTALRAGDAARSGHEGGTEGAG